LSAWFSWAASCFSRIDMNSREVGERAECDMIGSESVEFDIVVVFCMGSRSGPSSDSQGHVRVKISPLCAG
jgi:hypothetical protein